MTNATVAAQVETDHVLIAVAAIAVVTIVGVASVAAAIVFIVLQFMVWKREYEIERIEEVKRQDALMARPQVEQTQLLEVEVLADVGSEAEVEPPLEEEAGSPNLDGPRDKAQRTCVRSTEV